MNKLQEMYLDYVNNFLTVDRFAEYYHLTAKQAHCVIKLGKEHHEGGHLMNTKHTPGIVGEENKANARLIAAAPELLQLVKDLNYALYVVGTPKAVKEVMAKSKDLIAKAEGK